MHAAFKQVIAISQVSTTNAATATGIIDTLGFDRATIDVIMSTANVVSNNPSVFQLLDSDDTVVTNAATVSGFVGDTDWTIPDGNTDTNWGVKFNVDCRGRKRYLRLAISPVTTQVITAIANLYKADEAPVSATNAGVEALVEG